MGQRQKQNINDDLMKKKEKFKRDLRIDNKKLQLKTLDANKKFLQQYSNFENWQQFATAQVRILYERHKTRETTNLAANQTHLIEQRYEIYTYMLKFLEEHTESSLKWEEPILLQNLVANHTSYIDPSQRSSTITDQLQFSPRITLRAKFSQQDPLEAERQTMRIQKDKIVSKAVLKSLINGMEIEEIDFKCLRSSITTAQHPILKFVAAFNEIVCKVYSLEVDLVVANQGAQRAREILKLINYDVQEFLFMTLQVIRFFYRRCLLIDNKIFSDDVVEGITNRLFENNKGQLFDLMLATIKVVEQQQVNLLQKNMETFCDVSLQELNLELQLEKMQQGETTAQSPQNVSRFQSISFVTFIDHGQAALRRNLFSQQIGRLIRLLKDHKDPRRIMRKLQLIQDDITQQYLAYKWIQKNTDLQQFTNLSQDQFDQKIIELSQEMPENEKQVFVGLDQLLPCLIYVTIKAKFKELPALIPLIKTYTLDRRNQDFELTEINLLASIEFMQTQLETIRQTHLMRYTYLDGKSCYISQSREFVNNESQYEQQKIPRQISYNQVQKSSDTSQLQKINELAKSDNQPFLEQNIEF